MAQPAVPQRALSLTEKKWVGARGVRSCALGCVVYRVVGGVVWAGLVGVLAGGRAGWAQGPVDAGIRGHITAVCGPYPHACKAQEVRVQLTSVDSVVRREIQTDEDGNFLLTRLPPGEYQVRATSMRADKTTAVTTLELEGGDLAELMLTLEPQTAGMPSGPLVVPVLDEGAEAQLTTLPVESRQWEDLVELDSQAHAGAAAAQAVESVSDDQDDPSSRTSGGDGAAAMGLSMAGLAAIQSGQMVDGVSQEQAFRSGPRGSATGGPSSGSSFSQSSVRSFHVLPFAFSAQYGSPSGLSVVSRRATLQLHGSAFFLSRESAWAATNPFSVETHYQDGVVTSAAVKPAGSMMQFGGTVGLPLVRVKQGKAGGTQFGGKQAREPLAVFASVEVLLHEDRIVSTPAEANFFALSAEQVALLGTRGVTPAATNAGLDYLDSLTGVTRRSAYRVQGFGRVDAMPTTRDRASVSYAANRFDSPAGAALGQASDAVVARGTGSLGDSVVQVDAGNARWLHSFSARMNNEARAQVARDLEYETPHAPLPQEPGIGPGGYAPQVSIAPDGFAYGTPSNLGRKAYPDEVRVQVADSLQWQFGRHLLTLGGDWSRIHDEIDSVSAEEGSFSYDSGTTNGKDGGLVDWITDYTYNVNAYPNGACPSIVATVHYFCFRSFTQSFGGASTKYVTHNVSAFAEDALRVLPNLTMTVGARWEYQLLPTPQEANPTLDADVAALGLPVHGVTQTFPEDRNNFGPRVSAAWSPRSWSQKRGALFTLHVGYGVFFGKIPGGTIRAALVDTALPVVDAAPGSTLHIRIRPTTITDCPQVTAVQQGFGYPCDYATAPPAAVAQTTSATVFAKNYREPAVQRAAVSVEKNFGKSVNVRGSYAMALATQLPGSTDINVAPSPGMVSYVLQSYDGALNRYKGLREGQTFVVPLYEQRLIAAYGPITALVSNANATYHAGTVEVRVHGLRWPGLRQLELRGSYTFSRAIDYAPQSSATPSLNGQFDPFHNGYDKGLSSQQVPHRFTGDFSYVSRESRGPKVVREALSGWRVSGIGIASSGLPYSYDVFGGTYLSGGRESINGAGGATYLPTIGRNTLRLPARGTADVRVGREFRVEGRLRCNAFAEAFNLLNSDNVSRVETRAFVLGTAATIGSPTGSATSGGPTPLILQDAAAITEEGLTTQPAFGAAISSTTGVSRERQLELGLRLQF